MMENLAYYVVISDEKCLNSKISSRVNHEISAFFLANDDFITPEIYKQ